MDIKERIQQYLDYKKININQLETSIGASKSYWRKTKSISANVVLEISRVYSDISLEWLFREEGNMIKTDSDSLVNVDNSVEELKAEINQLKGENRILREQVGLGERKSKSAS
ncbi:MAG: hypothetical protein ACK5NR_07975 [Bacteroides reticulotermitis]